MSWGTFKEACLAILGNSHIPPPFSGADETDDRHRYESAIPRRVLYGLAVLGHCDFHFSDNDGEVMVAPPAFVKLPVDGAPTAVLAGQQHPSTVDRLSTLAQAMGLPLEVISRHQPDSLLPDGVVIRMQEEDAMAALACEAGFTFSTIPASWQLLLAADTLDAYLRTCEAGPSRTPTTEQFEPDKLCFTMPQIGQYERPAALERLRFPTGRYHFVLHLANGNHLLVDRDYGIYSILRENGVHVLRYDPQHRMLIVPCGARLPILFERAMTLVSGRVGHFSSRTPHTGNDAHSAGVYTYTDIPQHYVDVIARKLTQPLQYYRVSSVNR